MAGVSRFARSADGGDADHRTLRHSALLAVLVVIILIEPFTSQEFTLISFLGAVAVVALLLDGRRRMTQVAVALVGFVVLLKVLGIFWFPDADWLRLADRGPITILLLLLLIAALFYCSYLVLRSLIRARAVTSNEILGTLSLYLMIGLIWAFVYILLEYLVPGSFGSSSQVFYSERTSPFVYFSFVTQASLGYGDITPQLPLASRMVVLQAVMGQFYVAVVVAYLIAVFISQRNSGT
jgi:hypothetical protein